MSVGKAKVLCSVVHSHGGGVPLAAQAKESVFKFLFLDVGLLNQKLGVDTFTLEQMLGLHEGSLAEQFVGQELMTLTPAFQPASLYYWAREEKNAQAEVDYLFQYKNQIYPIEVKSGKSKKLTSMQIFLKERNLRTGVLTNTEFPRQLLVSSPKSEYRIIHLPIYAVCLLKEALAAARL